MVSNKRKQKGTEDTEKKVRKEKKGYLNGFKACQPFIGYLMPKSVFFQTVIWFQ